MSEDTGQSLGRPTPFTSVAPRALQMERLAARPPTTGPHMSMPEVILTSFIYFKAEVSSIVTSASLRGFVHELKGEIV